MSIRFGLAVAVTAMETHVEREAPKVTEGTVDDLLTHPREHKIYKIPLQNGVQSISEHRPHDIRYWFDLPKKKLEYPDRLRRRYSRLPVSAENLVKRSPSHSAIEEKRKPNPYEGHPERFDALVKKLGLEHRRPVKPINPQEASPKDLKKYGTQMLDGVHKDVQLLTNLLFPGEKVGQDLRDQSKKIVDDAKEGVQKTVDKLSEAMENPEVKKEVQETAQQVKDTVDGLTTQIRDFTKTLSGPVESHGDAFKKSMNAASDLIDKFTQRLPEDGPRDQQYKRTAQDLLKGMTKTIITTDYNDNSSVKKSIYSFRDGYRNAVKNIVADDKMTSEEQEIVNQADKVIDYFTSSLGNFFDTRQTSTPDQPAVRAWYYPVTSIFPCAKSFFPSFMTSYRSTSASNADLQEIMDDAMLQEYLPHEHAFPTTIFVITITCFLLLAVGLIIAGRIYRRRAQRKTTIAAEDPLPDREFVRLPDSGSRMQIIA